MSDGREKKGITHKEDTFYANSLSVTAFLGGITIAVMVLIIQSQALFEKSLSSVFPFISGIPGYSNFSIPLYDEVLIIITAVTGIFFILSTAANIRVASGERERKGSYASLVSLTANIGFLLLILVLLPALVFPFSYYGGFLILGLGIVTMIIFQKTK